MSQNKKFRKFAAASLAATATVVAVAPAVSAASQFIDVTEDNAHADNIHALVEQGTITGYPTEDGGKEFRPNEAISRQHVAVMLSRHFDLEVPENKTEILDAMSDIPEDYIYADEIASVLEAGIFIGSDGEFMPENPTQRQQMATVLVRAYGLEDNGEDVDINLENVHESHKESVKILAQHGLTTELDDFRPAEAITRGQFASFVVRFDEAVADDEVVEGPELQSVSQINANTYELTATFAEEFEAAELEGTKLTLDGPAGELTAVFEEVDNGVAVFAITDTTDLRPGDASADGTYTVTSSNFVVAEGTVTTYSEILTANVVQGFVYSEHIGDNGDRVEGAEVTVGDRTVKTDARGYYSIAANPGLREIKVTAPGHYAKTAEVVVDRNIATAANFDMVEYDRSNLSITGQALDSETNEGIKNAKVTLEANVDGEWTKVADKTTTDGKFAFVNKNVDDALVSSNYDALVDIDNQTNEDAVRFEDNDLNLGVEYRVVVEKSVQDDLYDNYHAETVEFELSEEIAQTDLAAIDLDIVEEIQAFNFEVEWAADAETSEDTFQVQLLDTDGREVLGTDSVIQFDVERDSDDDRQMAEAYDLVDNGELKDNNVAARLPDGTYFLRVANVDAAGNPVNAIAIIVVEVTEGEVVTTPVAKIQEIESATVDASIGNVRYDESLEGYATGDTLNVLDESLDDSGKDVKAYFDIVKKVNGVDVYVFDSKADGTVFGTVTENTFTVSVDGNGDVSSITNTNPFVFNFLEEGEYVAKPNGGYIRGTDLTFNAGSALSTVDANFSSSAKIAKIDLTGTDSDVADYETVNVNNIKLVDANGNTVAESGSFETTTPQNIVKDAFEGVAPAQYRLVVDVDGYKVKETDLQTVYDFQDAAFELALEEIEANTLVGTVRFADNNEAAVDAGDMATVALYDASGRLVHAQDVTTDSTFTLTDEVDGVLEVGEHTLVIRGEGFETKSMTVNIESGETRQNILVERGGQAKVDLRVYDSNGLSVVSSGSLTDAYFTSTTHSDYSATVTYDGEFDLNVSAPYYKSDAVLSAGDYTLTIEKGTTTDKYTTDLRIQDVNDTVLKSITIPSKSDAPLIPITVNFNSAEAPDYAVAFDENGNVVDTERYVDTTVNLNDTIKLEVPENGTYFIRVYSNGKFVGEQEVTVQDFERTVSVGLQNAER